MTSEIADALGLDKAAGALVATVEDGSPAAKAGVEAGDVVVDFNGTAVGSARDLSRLVADVSPGQRENLTVWRKGKRFDLNITVGQSGDEKRADASAGEKQSAAADVEVASIGLGLSDITEQARGDYNIPADQRGAVIEQVDPDKSAAAQGLQEGDVIVGVNQVPVAGASDARAAIEQAEKAGRKSVFLEVSRQGEENFLAVPFAKA